MARVDEPAATASRQILGLEDVPYAESGSSDDRVQGFLQAFYSLAQLTPDVPVPDAVATRVMDKLAAGDSAEESLEPAPQVDGIRSRLARIVAARVAMPTTALIMLIVALVLSVGSNILLSRTGPFRPEAAIHLVGTESSPDSRGVLLFDGTQVVLHASGLAELANGYRYVAWSTEESQPRYLGSLTMLDDATARLLTGVEEVNPVVVVTIEPGASPSSPSGPQILVGRVIE